MNELSRNKTDVISVENFNKIIMHYKLTFLDDWAKERMYGMVCSLGFDYPTLVQIFAGAKKMKILSSKDEGFIKFDLQNFINEELIKADQKTIEIMKEMGAIDYVFKKELKRTPGEKRTVGLDAVIKKCWTLAQRLTSNESKQLGEFTIENLDALMELAKLYASIVAHTPATMQDRLGKEYTRIADYIILERLNDLSDTTLKSHKKFASTFHDLIEELVNKSEKYGEKEQFTKDEIVTLLDDCTTIMLMGTKEKYIAIRDIFNEYIKELKTSVASPELKEQLSEMSAKKIFLRSTTVMRTLPENIEKATKLLLGKSVDEIIPQAPFNSAILGTRMKKDAELRNNFPKFKIQDMSAERQLDLMENNAYMFVSINTNNLYEALMGLTEIFCSAFKINARLSVKEKKTKLSALGFNIDKIITGDNIVDVLSNTTGTIYNRKAEDRRDHLIRNITTLTNYLSNSDIMKIVAHNFSFFFQDNNKLLSDINEIKSQCDGNTNSKTFKQLFDKYVNTRFSGLGDTNTATRRSGTQKPRGPKSSLERQKIGLNIKIIEEPTSDEEKCELLNNELNGISMFCNGEKTIDGEIVGLLEQINHDKNVRAKLKAKLKKYLSYFDSVEDKTKIKDIEYNVVSTIRVVEHKLKDLKTIIEMYKEDTVEFYSSEAKRAKKDSNTKYDTTISSLKGIIKDKHVSKNKSLIETLTSELSIYKNSKGALLKNNKEFKENKEVYADYLDEYAKYIQLMDCLNSILSCLEVSTMENVENEMTGVVLSPEDETTFVKNQKSDIASRDDNSLIELYRTMATKLKAKKIKLGSSKYANNFYKKFDAIKSELERRGINVKELPNTAKVNK